MISLLGYLHGAMLRENATTLVSLLEQLEGPVELGVVVRLSPAGSRGGGTDPTGGAVSGRDYLRRRQAQVQSVEEESRSALALAEEIHADLAERAEAACLLSSRRSDPALVLTAAYLVARQGLDGFVQGVKRIGQQKSGTCTIELTGPWPPYSFAFIDVAGAR